MKRILALAMLVATVLAPPMVLGQESLTIPSATQPSPKTVLYKQQVRYYYGKGGTDNQVALPFSLSFGIAKANSLSISTSGNFSQESSGLSDMTLSWKWRFQSANKGPLNTSRTALLTSLQMPTGTQGWSTGSFNPSLGVSHTSIIDRFGVGLFTEYKFNTGRGAKYDPTGMDSKYNTWAAGGSVLYRITPKKYGLNTKGALYGGVEGLALLNQGGTSLQVGPSLMYEAQTWVCELGWQFYPYNSGSMEKIMGMGVLGFRLFF